MKTTIKEFELKSDELRGCKNQISNLRNGQQFEDVDWNHVSQLEKKVKELEKNYFDLLPTQSVSYYIGSRSYYSDVVKIGKFYFSNRRKMTKSNGYYSIVEIEEITAEMESRMMDDMYYY